MSQHKYSNDGSRLILSFINVILCHSIISLVPPFHLKNISKLPHLFLVFPYFVVSSLLMYQFLNRPCLPFNLYFSSSLAYRSISTRRQLFKLSVYESNISQQNLIYYLIFISEFIIQCLLFVLRFRFIELRMYDNFFQIIINGQIFLLRHHSKNRPM